MSGSLVLQIAVGIVAGIALSLLSPDAGRASMLLGNLFVQALKAVAPVLVLVLVASAIANRRASHTSQLRPIVIPASVRGSRLHQNRFSGLAGKLWS